MHFKVHYFSKENNIIKYLYISIHQLLLFSFDMFYIYSFISCFAIMAAENNTEHEVVGLGLFCRLYSLITYPVQVCREGRSLSQLPQGERRVHPGQVANTEWQTTTGTHLTPLTACLWIITSGYSRNGWWLNRIKLLCIAASFTRSCHST